MMSTGILTFIFAVSAIVVPCQGQVGSNCLLPRAEGGDSFRWPTKNPALVAPVLLDYQYQNYSHPLTAELTDSALVIRIPPDFISNFNLTIQKGGVASKRKYALESIELRKPAVIPEGSAQALSHVLEASLVHREVTGTGYWANVVVPFEVQPDPTDNILAPLMNQAELPSSVGEVQPVLVSTAMNLNLESIFKDASFQHFWSTLPTGCPGKTVGARMIMRNQSLATTHSVINRVLDVLKWAPGKAPATPPKINWIMTTCPRGTSCSYPKPHSLDPQLVQAKATEAEALKNLAKSKAAMDASLLKLNSTVGNVSNKDYDTALDNRNALQNSAAAIDGGKRTVKNLELLIAEAKTAKWDADAPPEAKPVVAAKAKTPVTPAPVKPAVKAKPSLLAMQSVSATAHEHADSSGGCASALRLPEAVDLSTDAEHVDATTAGASEALLFWRLSAVPGVTVGDSAAAEAAAESPSLRVANLGDRLRISSPKGKPLLILLSRGQELPVSFADISVPGEHVTSGNRPSAEIQLVHLPKEQTEAATAVALQLDKVSDDDAGGNAWLQSLEKMALPQYGHQTNLHGSDPMQMHAALGRGVAGHFYRYDGRLPKSSACQPVTWHVLEERGRITELQLAALHQILLPPGSSQNPIAGLSALNEEVFATQREAFKTKPSVNLLQKSREAQISRADAESLDASGDVESSRQGIPSLRALLLARPRQQREEDGTGWVEAQN